MNFSVLLSIYKKEMPDYFNEAMDSIWSQQTLKPTEIILVKDGPLTEELNACIQTWQNKLPNVLKTVELQKNVGLGIALNKGLEKCQYELVVRMDTDDIATPNRFERLINHMVANPQLAIVGSSIQEFDTVVENLCRYRSVPLSTADIKRYAKYRSPFNHPSIAYRKSVIESVGGYQHHLLMEDYNLWIRVIAKGYEVENIEETLLLMRAGQAMLGRRRGLTYIKSEWTMMFLKNKYKIHHPAQGLLIFILRSIPRVLPSTVLKNLYSALRQ